jgi:hypothetical protein
MILKKIFCVHVLLKYVLLSYLHHFHADLGGGGGGGGGGGRVLESILFKHLD